MSLGEPRFARTSSYVSGFNCYKALTLNKAIVCKAFSKPYRRHSVLVEKYNVSFKTFLQQDISDPEFYGNLI